MKLARLFLCLVIASGACAVTQAAELGAGAPYDVTPKPTAPIGLSYVLGSEPVVGQLLEIQLAITPAFDLTGGTLSLSADDPLPLIEPVGDVSLGTIAGGATVDVTIKVLPLVDRTEYLNVAVSGEIDGVVQTRAIAIAVRLPSNAPLKTDSAPADKPGDGVSSFEAVESVR